MVYFYQLQFPETVAQNQEQILPTNISNTTGAVPGRRSQTFAVATAAFSPPGDGPTCQNSSEMSVDNQAVPVSL